MSTHLTADELADASAGVLSPDRTAEIDRHVLSCPVCADTARAVQQVPDLLADVLADRDLPMPVDVAARLEAAVMAEAARRASGEADRDLALRQAAHAKRNSTGSFGENPPTKRHTGLPSVAVHAEPTALDLT